jgi:hypothetical protein
MTATKSPPTKYPTLRAVLTADELAFYDKCLLNSMGYLLTGQYTDDLKGAERCNDLIWAADPTAGTNDDTNDQVLNIWQKLRNIEGAAMLLLNLRRESLNKHGDNLILLAMGTDWTNANDKEQQHEVSNLSKAG